MELVEICGNISAVINSMGTPIAIINDDTMIGLGDIVKVIGDCYGYICPTINQEGIGMVVKIVLDDVDHFYEILMDNGQRGNVKIARIKLIC